jgi:hypothetical protein
MGSRVPRHAGAASTVEWYTPPWLMQRIEQFLGSDLYDPCPARNGQPMERNGLAESWAGRRVYVNPPYGRAIVPWITKAMIEPVDELLMLTPAYTDTRWFQPFYSHAICFIRGRLAFSKPGKRDGRPVPAPHPSVLVYRGPRAAEFAAAFGDVGAIMSSSTTPADLEISLWQRSA